MNDEELTRSVNEQLFWDPRVDSKLIAAHVHDGLVTLRGTVTSYRQRWEATRAAERHHGVVAVKNELDVHPLRGRTRANADLRADVLRALMTDTAVPDTIDAGVEDGVVTLTGDAEWHYQRQEAEFVTGNVAGVVAVDNQISLAPRKTRPASTKSVIENALRRDARLDAAHLSVVVADGTVTLAGTVRSQPDRTDALSIAWAAPGVLDVKDDIVVRT